jgi:hypothetical protein
VPRERAIGGRFTETTLKRKYASRQPAPGRPWEEAWSDASRYKARGKISNVCASPPVEVVLGDQAMIVELSYTCHTRTSASSPATAAHRTVRSVSGVKRR